MNQPTNVERRILIVDDEPDIRDSLQTMLEVYGYAIVQAAGTTAALVAIAEHRPDLVLTDVFLGDDDGFALLHALRGDQENIPVIAMSGGGTSPDGEDALELAQKLGAVGVIDKPFRIKELIALIERTLGGDA